MTIRYSTDAFVLKGENSSEANRIFSVFTKEFGMVELVGRSIRKINSKLRGGIGLFGTSYLEFIQGKHRKTLTDAVVIERFKNIFNHPLMLEVAHKISEVAHHFIRGQEPDENIWGLLVDSFSKLNHCQIETPQCQLVYSYFFWNFVSVLGYAPQLSNCASCTKKLNPSELYFSNTEGGIICNGCNNEKREGLKINSDTVKVLRLILKKDWSILSRLKVENTMQKSLQDVSDSYYNYLSATHLNVQSI